MNGRLAIYFVTYVAVFIPTAFGAVTLAISGVSAPAVWVYVTGLVFALVSERVVDLCSDRLLVGPEDPKNV